MQSIIIYSDGTQAEHTIRSLLNNLSIKQTTVNKVDAVINLFKQSEEKVLLLCFSKLDEGIDSYTQFLNSYTVTCYSLHRTIAICTEQQAPAAARYCIEGKIDNYFCFDTVFDEARLEFIIKKSLAEMSSEVEFHKCSSYLSTLKIQAPILDKFVNESFSDSQNLIEYSISALTKLTEIVDKQLNSIVAGISSLETTQNINQLKNLEEQLTTLRVDSLIKPVASLSSTLLRSSNDWADEKFKTYSRLSRKIHVAPSPEKIMASRKILIVDDDEMFSDIIVAMLEAEGFIALAADGAEQALDILGHASPDVIVLDIDMPDISGIELLKIIRANEEWDEIPVLMLTGIIDDETLSASITAGANGFYAKPGSELEGFETIDALFRNDDLLQIRHKPVSTDSLMTLQQCESITPLVIDDDVFMLDIIDLLLKNMGVMEWKTANGGKDALKIIDASDNLYNVLIVDLNMPDMDGIELLRHLADRRNNAAIIIISGYGSRLLRSVENLGTAHRLNILGSLGKPITPYKLAELLNKVDIVQPANRIETHPQWLPTVDEISKGIKEGEFILYYQPKIKLQTNSLAGVEALARWRHPEKGILAPALFIEKSENSGLIGELTARLLRLAICQHMTWKAQGHDIDVSVNISMATLDDLGLPDFLSALIEEYGMKTNRLTLEITETGSRLNNHANVLDVLNRLRLRGFKLSIDDFGTGDSSFMKLKQMPFDQLKIDREFIHGASQDKDAHAIVDASVILSQDLNLEIVAEGIENIEDWSFSQNAGCDIIQGYFASYPLPADEIIPWIEDLPSIGKKFPVG